jgi:O-antigen/teichoic acid export membrane protein
MRFGSAGIKSAFQKYVAEATGSGDFESANKLLSTGSFSLLAVSLVTVIPVTIFSKALARVSGIPPEFIITGASSISILACIYVVANFGAAFEAVVMGCHRVDLTRKYSTVMTIAEAIAILTALHFGCGLLTMTAVMGMSELVYIGCCYLAARRIAQQIEIHVKHITCSVVSELIRFAGSYQLVNVLELLYLTIIPIAILKHFGADAAGVLALAGRVVNSVLIVQDALVHPLLSGGAVVFAAGSQEQLRLFLAKAFKATLGAAVPPLAFVSAFGATMIFAWTGEASALFHTVVRLCAIAQLFRVVSLIQLVLYRASGRALLDNVRQVLRIAGNLTVASFASRIGFAGVLGGMAAAELAGVVFMFFALRITFKAFNGRQLAEDAGRILIATAIIIGCGALTGMALSPPVLDERIVASLKFSLNTLGCLIAAWPVLLITGSLNDAEKRALSNISSRLFSKKARGQ